MDKKTPVFDWDKGDFATDYKCCVATVTGMAAVEQIAIKAHATPRGQFLIYGDTENPDLDHKYGSDVLAAALGGDLSKDARISEIKRAIREALIYDPWIKDVSDIELSEVVTPEGEKQTVASYTITTIYDNQLNVEGVKV